MNKLILARRFSSSSVLVFFSNPLSCSYHPIIFQIKGDNCEAKHIPSRDCNGKIMFWIRNYPFKKVTKWIRMQTIISYLRTKRPQTNEIFPIWNGSTLNYWAKTLKHYESPVSTMVLQIRNSCQFQKCWYNQYQNILTGPL